MRSNRTIRHRLRSSCSHPRPITTKGSMSSGHGPLSTMGPLHLTVCPAGGSRAIRSMSSYVEVSEAKRRLRLQGSTASGTDSWQLDLAVWKPQSVSSGRDLPSELSVSSSSPLGFRYVVWQASHEKIADKQIR